jgi:pyridoxal/pyridoxine/pyridoxamine kinase
MVKTSVKFGAKDYALVPDRIKQFREDNPRGSIVTDPTIGADGSVIFKATIIKDLSDEYSARATGSAHYNAVEIKKPKSFEKLETIATGRALAMLGYLNDGQVATTEEMAEFEQFKQDKFADALEKIKKAEKRDEFKQILADLTPEQKLEATPVINERIQELKKAVAK